MYTVYCTLHNVHCSLNTSHCKLNTDCTMNNAPCPLHIANCTLLTGVGKLELNRMFTANCNPTIAQFKQCHKDSGHHAN